MRRAERVGRRRRVRRRRAGLRRVGLAVVVGSVVAGSVVVLASGGEETVAKADPVKVTEVTPDSVSLSWSTMGAASTYAVEIATDPSMADKVTKEFDRTTGTVEGLEQGTRYWIRVDPVGAADGSDTISARTEAVGVATFEGEPKVDDTSAEIDWSDVEAASAYVVQVSDDESFEKPRAETVDESKVTIDDLTPATDYWVRVAVAGQQDTTKAVGPWTEPSLAFTTVDNAVRTGTFNISGVHNDRSNKKAPDWRLRRAGVVSQIHDSDLDVVGLQEASMVDSGLYRRNLLSGNSQMADLVNGLRDAGGDWKATSTDRNLSNDTRIAYRADRLELVDQGGRKFSAQVKENQRYLAWAIFKVKKTGREFLFVTAHLTPRSESVRGRQWSELVSFTKSTAGDRPVVVAGDFNSSKFHMPAGRMLPTMEAAGFGDVLGQRYRNPSGDRIRAEKTVRANIGSFNDYGRRPGGYGEGRVGNSVDYIFASNDLVVREFSLVGDFSAAGTLEGVIPSDHFLLTAVVEIS